MLRYLSGVSGRYCLRVPGAVRRSGGYGSTGFYALGMVSPGAYVMHLYGPGGPGVVAVACGQEDRGDAYVRAVWFDLRRGRGCTEELEALRWGPPLAMVATPVAIQLVWKWCHAPRLDFAFGWRAGLS